MSLADLRAGAGRGESFAMAPGGYLDTPIPQTMFRLRYDSGFDLNRPDRAQFFWSHMLRLAERWRSGQRTFIVTGAECERELEASLAPAPQVLVRDGDRVVLVNFPALPGR